MCQVVWFKRDLRTIDHAPLLEAASAGPVTPLYVVEPEYWEQPDTSCRQWCAARSALTELGGTLAGLGAPLVVRVGSAVDWLARLHREVGITRILAHEETGNAWTFARDRSMRAFCRKAGIALREYPQFGVARGLRDRDRWGQLHERFIRQPLVPAPRGLTAGCHWASDVIPTPEALGLAEDGCATPQSGGRREALGLLGSFFDGRGADYRRAMSTPLAGAEACSRLSVALSTGAVSLREVLARCETERALLNDIPPDRRPIPVTAVDSLISRLHWHCHFIQKLESEPDLEFRSLHPAHEAARRVTDPDDPALEAWATGQTGFPFLDACMRCLIATGWLNFRMRAMVQAFASYHLALDWRASGLRLARLFTDYEPGIHWPQVQMQSGQTGINTPRIYNPVKQGMEQDPTAAFTRRWVPELRGVPATWLQTPWRMDGGTQRESGCLVGRDYPAPIVDHAVAVSMARDRLRRIRAEPGYLAAAEAVFARHGSRKRRLDQDMTPRPKPRIDRQLGLDV